MNIGIIIGRIGGVDGVALETEKWIDVLNTMGHQVFTLSGQYQERPMDPESESLVPEMSFFSPESFWSQKKAFFYPETHPGELIEHLNLYSKVIYKKIMQWIGERNIDLLISEHACSLPSHLEMGMAIKMVNWIASFAKLTTNSGVIETLRNFVSWIPPPGTTRPQGQKAIF